MTEIAMAAVRQHPSDGALVRLLDQECETAEAAGMETHLSVCSSCRDRFEQLGARLEALGAVLAEVDLPGPADAPSAAALPPADPVPSEGAARSVRSARSARSARSGSPSGSRFRLWPRTPRLAAAATVLLAVTIGAALTVGPVRAWIAEGLRVSVAALPWSDGPADPGPVPDGFGVVHFVSSGPVLSIEFANAPARGELIVQPHAGARVSARALGEGRGDELVVLPSGLRVLNAAGGDASVRVTVPASVVSVHAVVAGRVIGTFPIDASLSEPVVIPLTR